MSGIPTAPASLPAPRGRRRAPGRPGAAPTPYGPPPAGSGGGEGHDADAGDAAGDVVRWAAFSCALVPMVLVAYGTSLGGAASAALGLAAVTTVCRVLLRQSERAAAADRAEQTGQMRQTDLPQGGGPDGRHPGGHGRIAPGAHRGGRHAGGGAPGE
ncbi:MAG TPA: hypothetical protein VFH94_11845 [Streptomyces sp.]|nr:hypothetical protein [Streptomyces sp.]